MDQTHSNSNNSIRSPSRNTQNSSYGAVQRFGEEYDELLGGSVPCPTCQGAGRIPKEREHEMVALIPLSDKRLKPRRTVLYVLLAILICVLLAGLLIFFLFPRSVHLQSNMPNIKPTYLYVNTSQEYVFMTVVIPFNISNTNFFSIDVTDVTVNGYFDQRVIATVTNDTRLTIPLKAQRTSQVQMNLTFSGDEGYIAHYCDSSTHYGHTLLMPFQASAVINAMGRSEESVLTTYQHVRCSTKKT